MKAFLEILDAALSRRIESITVFVLHGQPQQIATIAEAIDYLQSYPDTQPSSAPAARYEIGVRFNNGDVIHGIFQTKDAAISFLRHSTA